ncbi:MAG: hypothetical protein QM711_13925 [Micropruina sp.]|uniref:hypothetical protein n=1 Tax=Micropruina sp. TaxID=2737536 RepID=UPI0039E3B626
MPYKVVMQYDDGSSEIDDEVFDTEEEAQAYGLVCVSNYSTGAEVLHLSNPGDYPLNEDEEVDFEVVEVDD